jgi:uncharacterized membrane protein YgdD (TMEM256/DUF423 family)
MDVIRYIILFILVVYGAYAIHTARNKVEEQYAKKMHSKEFHCPSSKLGYY